MKLINLFSLFFILIFLIQPISAENKILTQPTKNHFVSYFDYDYIIEFTMATNSFADPSRGTVIIRQIFPNDGSCSLNTEHRSEKIITTLSHSGREYSVKIRGLSSLRTWLDSIFNEYDPRTSNNADDPRAYDIGDEENFNDFPYAYFCFSTQFFFGYTDGILSSNTLLFRFYENKVPDIKKVQEGVVLFNFLSLLIALPILVILRRKK